MLVLSLSCPALQHSVVVPVAGESWFLPLLGAHSWALAAQHQWPCSGGSASWGDEAQRKVGLQDVFGAGSAAGYIPGEQL